MYHVVLTETFYATHTLDLLRPEVHGHDWVVRVTLSSDRLIEPGIVMNYFELQPLVKSLLPEGQHLNECFDFAPTGENLARHFYHQLKPQLPLLSEVAVGEFLEFMCIYRPD